VHAEGALREWSNGNLHALLEPTRTGHRLRLGTFKGSALISVTAGVFTVGMSAVVGAAAAVNGTLSQAAVGLVAMASMGAALLANGTLRLPGWAQLRRRQIDGIVERLAVATHVDHGPGTAGDG
jgi:hypothetical protein